MAKGLRDLSEKGGGLAREALGAVALGGRVAPVRDKGGARKAFNLDSTCVFLSLGCNFGLTGGISLRVWTILVFIEVKLSIARSQVELERVRHLLCLSVGKKSSAQERILGFVMSSPSMSEDTARLRRLMWQVDFTFLGVAVTANDWPMPGSEYICDR